MSDTTVPNIKVRIEVISTCPICRKRVERMQYLTYEALVTMNTTQQATYWAESMVREVNETIRDRGWNDVMCGTCRDNPDECRRAKEGGKSQ